MVLGLGMLLWNALFGVHKGKFEYWEAGDGIDLEHEFPLLFLPLFMLSRGIVLL
jgi:hypothetical protein